MSMIAAKSWLPAELTIVQPYSMGPLMCGPARCAQQWVAPATGTCVGMDRPELMISSVFVAPMDVQRQAQKQGVRGIVMQHPPGLAEILDADPKLWPQRPMVTARRVAVGGQDGVPFAPIPAEEVRDRGLPDAARQTFAETLAALEDDEEI